MKMMGKKSFKNSVSVNCFIRANEFERRIQSRRKMCDEWFDMMCVCVCVCVLLTPILSFKNYAFICGVFCYGICLVITL